MPVGWPEAEQFDVVAQNGVNETVAADYGNFYRGRGLRRAVAASRRRKKNEIEGKGIGPAVWMILRLQFLYASNEASERCPDVGGGGGCEYA